MRWVLLLDLIWLIFLSCNTRDHVNTKQGFIPVGDSRINFETSGSGDPIIFIHGGFLDRRMWKDQVNEFSLTNRVITFDLPGHGATIDGDSSFYVSDAIKKLMDSLEVQSSTVVGLSLGAMAAMDFVVTHPGYVNKLILATPGLSGLRFNVPEDSLLRKYSGLMNKALVENNIPAAAEFFVRSWYDGPLRNASELDSAKRKKVTRMVEETLRNHKRTHWPRFKENSSINHLGQVQIPVCIIEGRKDNRVISLNCDTLSSILSNSKRIVIDNAAHMPNLDNSEEFNRIIKDFIQKLN